MKNLITFFKEKTILISIMGNVIDSINCIVNFNIIMLN